MDLILMHLRLLRVPTLTQIIYKEVTLIFQIVQIALMIPTALYIQRTRGTRRTAKKGISLMNYTSANHVQVRKQLMSFFASIYYNSVYPVGVIQCYMYSHIHLSLLQQYFISRTEGWHISQVCHNVVQFIDIVAVQLVDIISCSFCRSLACTVC